MSKKYKLDSGTCLARGGLIVTNSWAKKDKINKTIHSKQYDKDMYLIAYYTARSMGDDHDNAIKFAKENVNDLKYKKVVHIDDVNNILKKHIKLEDK